MGRSRQQTRRWIWSGRSRGPSRRRIRSWCTAWTSRSQRRRWICGEQADPARALPVSTMLIGSWKCYSLSSGGGGRYYKVSPFVMSVLIQLFFLFHVTWFTWVWHDLLNQFVIASYDMLSAVLVRSSSHLLVLRSCVLDNPTSFLLFCNFAFALWFALEKHFDPSNLAYVAILLEKLRYICYQFKQYRSLGRFASLLLLWSVYIIIDCLIWCSLLYYLVCVQVLATKSVLQRPVSLIQGPPGTAKLSNLLQLCITWQNKVKDRHSRIAKSVQFDLVIYLGTIVWCLILSNL